MICENILEAMGETPLIRLNNMASEDAAEILVKFEGLNVGGSVKTRTAYNMIETAEREGRIGKGSIIVEPTSGTNVAAAIRLAKKLGKGKTVVTVLPDTAERYFSTPLFG